MTMLLHTRGFLLRLVNLCLVSSTAVKDSWMMTLQPAEEGMCLPPHLPRSLSPAVDSFVLWLCCQNRRKSLDHRRVAETQILSNPTLNSHTCTSSLWRVMMGLTNTPAELWFSLQKKKSPSVNSNQFSIVAKLSRSAVYLKTYLTSPSSSPPPTLNIQYGFHWSPTSGVLHLLLLKLFWKRPSTPAVSTSLHFQTSAFATDLVFVLSALVTESTVGTLVWHPWCEGETVVIV